MSAPRFDFRTPPPGALETHAAGWLTAAAKRAVGPWAALLPFPATVAAGPVEGLTAASAVARLPADAVGFRLAAADTPHDSLLLAVPRPLVLALVAGMMGDTPDALPADRDLTAAEVSLCAYMAHELFAAPLQLAWPAAEDPIQLSVAPPAPPRAAWRVPGEDMALLGTLIVSAPFGEVPAAVVVPRFGAFEKLSKPIARPKVVPTPAAGEHIEKLVKQMAVDLAVVLGEADLSMRELTALTAGDLIVLRQKVTDPLDASVGGERKFRVWPGAVGGQSAVRVHALAD